MSNTISDAESNNEILGYSNVNVISIISSGLVGALFGGVIFPIYKYFDISFGKEIGENIKKYSNIYQTNRIGFGYEIQVLN